VKPRSRDGRSGRCDFDVCVALECLERCEDARERASSSRRIDLKPSRSFLSCRAALRSALISALRSR
jgi:hypothetical protein